MSWPFGETGVGKIGLMPPTLQADSAAAPITIAHMVRSERKRPATRLKYIDGSKRNPASGFGYRIESGTDGGRSTQASLCRRVQPRPGSRVSQLRVADGAFHRPVPQLRLQALALESRRVGGIPPVA